MRLSLRLSLIFALGAAPLFAAYHVLWASEVFGTEETLGWLIAFALAGTGLAGAVGYFVTARILGERMARLVRQAHDLGNGVLATNHDSATDELGQLATELNTTVDRLAAAQKQVREQRRERTALAEQLRHADRLSTVGKIASGIAHEIGTPLNVVSGRTMMLLDREGLDPSARENLEIVLEQTERIAEIVRQLLDFSRRSGVKRAPTSMGDLMDQAVTLLEPLAETSHVSIRAATGRDLEASIDRGKALQVLTNLMMNGIQAMPSGGRLEIGACAEQIDRPRDRHAEPGPFVCIYVKDQGRGIAPDKIERVFEPFFTTKRAGEGTGLGLSVCQGIVQDQDGWIEVESELGRGSCFKVYVPRGGTS